MQYIFKEKITYKQYEKFMKKQNYLSFMQEDKWAKVKNNSNHLIVAVLYKDEVCALAHILINKKILGKQFLIPNGYLIDYTNISLLEFMTYNIKNLARKKKAYIVDIYPNIITSDKTFNEIHNNLISLNYVHTKKKLDNTENILIPLKRNNKKIPITELKRKYENKDFYTKRGIYFEISNNIKDINRMEYIINKDFFKFDLVKGLLNNYNERVYIIFAKLDLVFYKNYIQETEIDENQLNKINELLEISDEIDIGCALVIEPYNTNKTICEFLYNFEKESFENLDIMNGLLYEALKICNKKNYHYLKISNIDINPNQYITRYKGKQINYIGNYTLIINKVKKIINTEIELSKKN